MLCFFQNQSMAALVFLLLVSTIAFSEAVLIGVNYGRVANNLPPPASVVQLLKSQGLTRVKLYDTDSATLLALANSGISVTVGIPNVLLSAAAYDLSFTDQWVKSNIFPYFPVTRIEAIAVGNEVFKDPNNRTPFLLPAMKNIHSSLVKYNLDSAIKISSPIPLSSLQCSFPPSSASFLPELIDPVIRPMLDFLRRTGSYLMVNAYPYFAYSADSRDLSLDYALFRSNPGEVDSGNGLKYFNLFEAQLDSVFAAMSALGYDDLNLVVSETGWPTKSDSYEVGASPANAATYNQNLVRRVLAGNGTPRRPWDPLNVFLFELFDEDLKTGPASERNYGFYYAGGQKVYDLSLTGANNVVSLESTRVSDTRAAVSSVGQTWCVANQYAAVDKLQAGLNYACGQGLADCRPIQAGSTCYNPNTLVAHAAYAFNSFYQKNQRAAGSCDFGGAAFVVTQPPNFGNSNCVFPTGC